MYKIVKRQQLNDTVVRLDVQAPFIAKKAKAGQFIIFRIDEHGERIPLTIADTDAEKGTVSIIFQIVVNQQCFYHVTGRRCYFRFCWSTWCSNRVW